MMAQLDTGGHIVGYTDEIPPGARKIVSIGGREIGVFNIDGTYRAFLNRCPHMGGALCEGDVLGLVESDGPGDFRLDEGRRFLTCPLHAWEFDVETGQSYLDPTTLRARVFPVETQPVGVSGADPADAEQGPDGRVPGPYVAENFDVTIERDAVVVHVRRPRRK